MKLFTLTILIILSLTYCKKVSKNSPIDNNNDIFNVSGDLSCELLTDNPEERNYKFYYSDLEGELPSIKCSISNFSSIKKENGEIVLLENNGAVVLVENAAKHCQGFSISKVEDHFIISGNLSQDIYDQNYCRIIVALSDATSGEKTPIGSIYYYFKRVEVGFRLNKNPSWGLLSTNLGEITLYRGSRDPFYIHPNVSISCASYTYNDGEIQSGCPLGMGVNNSGQITLDYQVAATGLYKVRFKATQGDFSVIQKRPFYIHQNVASGTTAFASINSPSNFDVINSLSPSSIPIEGSCFPSGASITVTFGPEDGSNDQSLQAPCNSGEFSLSLSKSAIPEGSLKLSVSIDSQELDSISLAKDTTPASASLTSHINGSQFGGETQQISGSCSENSELVHITYNGSMLTSICNNNLWHATLNLLQVANLDNINVTLEHQDSALNPKAEASYTFIKNTSVLSFTFSSPIYGENVNIWNINSFIVEGTCSEAGTIMLFVPLEGGGTKSTSAICNTQYSTNFDLTGIKSGIVPLTGYLINSSSNTSNTETVYINVDLDQPLVSFTSPNEGSTVTGIVMFAGNCSIESGAVELSTTHTLNSLKINLGNAVCYEGKWSIEANVNKMTAGSAQVFVKHSSTSTPVEYSEEVYLDLLKNPTEAIEIVPTITMDANQIFVDLVEFNNKTVIGIKDYSAYDTILIPATKDAAYEFMTNNIITGETYNFSLQKSDDTFTYVTAKVTGRAYNIYTKNVELRMEPHFITPSLANTTETFKKIEIELLEYHTGSLGEIVKLSLSQEDFDLAEFTVDALQWQVENSIGSGIFVDITGQTSPSYIITEDSLAKKIRLHLTGHNNLGEPKNYITNIIQLYSPNTLDFQIYTNSLNNQCKMDTMYKVDDFVFGTTITKFDISLNNEPNANQLGQFNLTSGFGSVSSMNTVNVTQNDITYSVDIRNSNGSILTQTLKSNLIPAARLKRPSISDLDISDGITGEEIQLYPGTLKPMDKTALASFCEGSSGGTEACSGNQVQIASISNHDFCYINGDGYVYCKGSNLSRGTGRCDNVFNPNDNVTQVVSPDFFDRDSPDTEYCPILSERPKLTGVTYIAAGQAGHSTFQNYCAISNGEVYCWGKNSYGIVSPGDSKTDFFKPNKIAGLSDVVSVSLSPYAACAVKKNGRVYCWGRNRTDPFDTMSVIQPTQLPGIFNAVYVSLGENHGCVLLSNGEVKCWGKSAYGRLGRGYSPVTSSSEFVVPPVPVCLDEIQEGNTCPNPLSDVVAVRSTMDANCALRSDGTALCWGKNIGLRGAGNLFSDSSFYSSKAVPVYENNEETDLLTGIVDLAIGEYMGCYLMNDATMRCAGDWRYRGDGHDDSLFDRHFYPTYVTADKNAKENIDYNPNFPYLSAIKFINTNFKHKKGIMVLSGGRFHTKFVTSSGQVEGFPGLEAQGELYPVPTKTTPTIIDNLYTCDVFDLDNPVVVE